MKLFSFLPNKKNKYVLVISWWGTRGFYALWILKWLEELGYKDKIDAIYGVSAGAIVASYRAAGYSAQEIYEKFSTTKKFFGFNAFNLFPKKSLIKSLPIGQQFAIDLPKDIADLQKKVYIGVTDANLAKFMLFDRGELARILLWSISIPGIFPAISYHHYVFMDGWVTNNFPVVQAKQEYPNHKIIGIALNKFKENQKINTVFDTLSVSFEILLRANTVEHLSMVDEVFYKEIPLKVLDTSKKNIQKAYAEGYQDCLAHFKS